jgi:hypothetical protein
MMTRDWTTVEQKTLRDMWSAGASVQEISIALPGRTVGAIKSRRNSLKLQRAGGVVAPREMKTWLRAIDALRGSKGMTVSEIMAAAGISKGMCIRIVHERHHRGLYIAGWRTTSRKPAALWALGKNPDGPYPVQSRASIRKETRMMRSINPFTTLIQQVAA